MEAMARVLIVDDEAEVRRFICQTVKIWGIEGVEVGDGVQASEFLQRERPDLMIVDILMPRKGGLNTIKEARERYPDLPVIAISGGGRDGKLNFLSTARTFSGVRTLMKPFRPAELLEEVRQSLPELGAKGRPNREEGTGR